MDVAISQNERKHKPNTTTIWRALLEALPVYCNPMLDTLDPKTLELIDSLPTQPIYDDKSLEMAILHKKISKM